MAEKPVERNSKRAGFVDYRGKVSENNDGSFLKFESGEFLPQSGPVAQLGARFHGMEEVVGSIPTRSTKFKHLKTH
jgi:hypothetical protein